MKVTLEFNLPEDADEHQTAVDGGKWKSVVWDLDQFLRHDIKYAEGKKTSDDIRTELYRILEEDGLVL